MHWAGALKESSSSPRRVASVRSGPRALRHRPCRLRFCMRRLDPAHTAATAGSRTGLLDELRRREPAPELGVVEVTDASKRAAPGARLDEKARRAHLCVAARIHRRRTTPAVRVDRGRVGVRAQRGRREHRVAAQRRHRRRPRPAGRGESRPPVPSRAGGASCTSSGQQGCSMPSRSSPGTTRRAIRDS